MVELIRTGDKDGQIFLPTRDNVKAGENLFIGRVIHAGESQFKTGQLVMFMEYSMAGFYKDLEELAAGKVSLTDTMKPENQYYVISEDDVMCYDA